MNLKRNALLLTLVCLVGCFGPPRHAAEVLPGTLEGWKRTRLDVLPIEDDSDTALRFKFRYEGWLWEQQYQ